MDLKNIFMKNKTIKESKVRLSEDSLDAQLDSILIGYQNDSSLEDELGEGTMPAHFKILLGEGPEDNEEEEDMSVGDEQQRAEEPASPKEQKINLDEFAQNVVNLLENYGNLLNFQPVIINRAKNLLERGYLPELVEEFLEILEQDFGYSLEQEDADASMQDEVEPPPAGGSTGPIGL